jgi:fused signal recognition particle receptor
MISNHPFAAAVVLLVAAVSIASLVSWALRPWLEGTPAGKEGGGRQAAPRASWGSALAKTRGGLTGRLIAAWHGPDASDVWLAAAEEALLTADVGVKATRALLEGLSRDLRRIESAGDLRALLRSAVHALLREEEVEKAPASKPWVVLVVGVNGVGKTTTIGKLAHRYRQAGKKVLLVAGDTFRAAAIEQLDRWARRAEVGIVKHQHGADPSAVAFDGMKAALARDVDVVLIDTAGRLHVKENLMEELKKVRRTIERQVAGAPHEVLLVVDATTGQNALSQARVFHEALGVTGVALAKLDGTAKGGIALAIRSECGIPIRLAGLGEQLDDLAPFDAGAFAEALFADADPERLEEPSPAV